MHGNSKSAGLALLSLPLLFDILVLYLAKVVLLPERLEYGCWGGEGKPVNGPGWVAENRA